MLTTNSIASAFLWFGILVVLAPYMLMIAEMHWFKRDIEDIDNHMFFDLVHWLMSKPLHVIAMISNALHVGFLFIAVSVALRAVR
jgi:hypothetical protein